jgi:hypothetical protein
VRRVPRQRPFLVARFRVAYDTIVSVGKKYFTQLDFNSGYWQIEMEEKSKEMNGFRTEDDLS